MGADMLITWMSAPAFNSMSAPVLKEFGEENPWKIRDLWMTLIRNRLIYDAAISAKLDDIVEARQNGEENYIYLVGMGEDITEVIIKKAMSVAVGYNREVAWLNVGVKMIIATGGLSWGDPPTDCWDDIELLDEIGLFDSVIDELELLRAIEEVNREQES